MTAEELSERLVKAIRHLRKDGCSDARIARILFDNNTPMPDGGICWTAADVRAVLDREAP